MRVTIISNQSEKSMQVAQQLESLLQESDTEISDLSPDIVISVGGDGTLLSAFHRYAHILDKVRFIGVHTGHLGFYTDWREFNLEDLVEQIKQDKEESEQYPLLDVRIAYSDGKEVKHYLALNESILKLMDKTLVCDVFIRDEFFERFRGDGLCVSTPTGSTGYNKSVGGAVLHPRLEALQVTEIASLNNRVFRTLSSPLVIAPDEWITLKPINTSTLILMVDQLVSTEEAVEEVKLRIAKERVSFARYDHTHFWDRVENAFLGVKKRNASNVDD